MQTNFKKQSGFMLSVSLELRLKYNPSAVQRRHWEGEMTNILKIGTYIEKKYSSRCKTGVQETDELARVISQSNSLFTRPGSSRS